jgi:DNA-damage-inducible protein J
MNLAHSRQEITKDVVVRARINSKLKHDVEGVLDGLGLSMSEAITLYLAQIKLRGGIPFPIEIPNEETTKAIHEARLGKGVVVCKDADDMFRKLGI